MLNAVNINYLIIALVNGAVLLAAIYHTVLFFHRKTTLLAEYSTYLWFTFLYTTYRFVYPFGNLVQHPILEFINADETLQMFCFAFYIRFIGTALDLDSQKEKFACFFKQKSPLIILVYLIIQIVLINLNISIFFHLVCKFLIRFYLLFVGFFMLISVILKRKKLYYNYLGAGATSIIFFGLLSTIITIIDVNRQYTITSVSWLMIGFFTDVIFFSSAIGYKIKIDAIEKEVALKMLIQQSEVLQHKEIEKIEAIYKTKEQERSRIANDLHDDIGATLSSMHIYGDLAGKVWDTQPHESKKMIDKISSTSKNLMERMGDIIWSMKPSDEEKYGFTTKLKNYSTELLAAKNIECFFKIDETITTQLTQPEVRKNLLLITKEAMNNIAKYSQASKAIITLIQQNKQIQLNITDNGKGFDVANAISGNGIQNIINRCKQLNGVCKIESTIEQGTTINCSFPIAIISHSN